MLSNGKHNGFYNTAAELLDGDIDLFDFKDDCDGIWDDSGEDYGANCNSTSGSGDSGDTVSVTTGCATTTKRRHRPYKRPPRKVVPRLLKSDVRKLYSIMFVNVLNGADYSLWSSYFETFCAKQMHFTQVSPELPILYPNAPRNIDIMGSEHCAKFIFNRMLNFPDIAMQIKETRMYVRLNGESTITTSFKLSGTKLHDVPSERLIYSRFDAMQLGSTSAAGNSTDSSSDNVSGSSCDGGRSRREVGNVSSNISCMGVVSHAAAANSSPGSCWSTRAVPGKHSQESGFVVDYVSQIGEKGKLLGYSVEDYQALLNSSPPLPEPLHMEMEGTFTMFLDANKMVTRFLFDTVVKEIPHLDALAISFGWKEKAREKEEGEQKQRTDEETETVSEKKGRTGQCMFCK